MPAKTVAVELVEKAGINVKTLLNLLISNASAELTTFYYYTILRVNLIGLEGEGLKQIAEDARIEDRNHFEALVPRIYELGGKLPEDMVEFHNISACPPARLPADPTDIKAMLNVLLKAEQCAVRGYTKICDMTFGKDHRTYDLALATGTIAVRGGRTRLMWASSSTQDRAKPTRRHCPSVRAAATILRQSDDCEARESDTW